jgi:hypothetical protein
MRAVVAAVDGDVDGDVADDPHAPLGGVGAQRAPFAFEAHLRLDRTRAGEGRPVVGPRLARPERPRLARLHAGVRVGQQAVPGREGRIGRVRRVELVRRVQREDLPPAAARGREPVHEPERLGPETAARERRRMELDTQ